MVGEKAREARWEEEARFFDAWARTRQVSPIPAPTLARYGAPELRPWYSKEFRMGLLGAGRGGLVGKHVLDLGCGDGRNSVLLAKLGARVTGIDLSREVIEVARERARVNGVAVRLVCGPIETADLPDDAFDVVWGDAILHHVLDDLEAVMTRAARWTRPSGTMVFAEPVNLSPTLRWLRKRLPLRQQGTPGERPLEAADLGLIGRAFERLEVRRFQLLARVDRFLLTRGSYETSSAPRRRVLDGLARLDGALFEWPLPARLTGPLAATMVLFGHPRKS